MTAPTDSPVRVLCPGCQQRVPTTRREPARIYAHPASPAQPCQWGGRPVSDLSQDARQARWGAALAAAQRTVLERHADEVHGLAHRLFREAGS